MFVRDVYSESPLQAIVSLSYDDCELNVICVCLEKLAHEDVVFHLHVGHCWFELCVCNIKEEDVEPCQHVGRDLDFCGFRLSNPSCVFRGIMVWLRYHFDDDNFLVICGVLIENGHVIDRVETVSWKLPKVRHFSESGFCGFCYGRLSVH